jgi:Pyridoxamine 5'-phosphate oxidase
VVDEWDPVARAALRPDRYAGRGERLHFDEFSSLAPEIAERVLDRFRTTGLAILGTIRSDGSPRVSPIEVAIHDGRVYVGMMPGSTKHLDVVRDPRVALLTPVADRHDIGGEGKLFGRLEAVDAPPSPSVA